MKEYRLKSLLIMALVAISVIAAPRKSILSLKESITDDNIQFPYSFETNTQELMKNWYLQNYAVVDKDVENKNPGDVSDAEYISRLKAIPSGIELPFNQVVKSYIERYTHRERTLVAEMLGMSPYYMPIFEQALEKHGMPLELKYIPVIESALNPNAVSPVGASGLWQFMLETGRNQHLEVNSLVDERRDPYRSSDAAADLFKKLYNIYGDWSLAIAAYNCGPGTVNKALVRASKGDKSAKPDFWEIYNYLPRETRGYVPAFIAATYVMHYYKEHNISPSLVTKPLIIDTVKVNRRLNFAQISKVLNIPIDEIRILNPQYRHDVIPGDNHPYTLALPSQQIYSFILDEDSINNYRNDLYAVRTVREPGTPNDAPESANNYGYSEPTVQQSAPATTATASQASSSTASSSDSDDGDDGFKYYKVKRGEDIESIASRFNTTVDDLMTLNSLSRRHVSRGQVLKVPDGSSAQAQEQTQAASSQQDVAQRAPSAPATPAASQQETAPATPAQAFQAATPLSSSEATSSDGTYTPYAGSYSIDDEVTREINDSYSRKAQAAEKQAAEKKAAEKRAAEKRAAEKQREATAKQEKEEAAKKASARKSKKQNDDDEQATTKKKRSRKQAQDEEQTSSRKQQTRSRKQAQDEQKQQSRSKKNRRNKADKDEEAKPSSHEVQRGESLDRIARNNGVTVEELRKANPNLKGSHIEPGQKVNIPSSKKSKASKRGLHSKNNDDEASASKKSKKSKKSNDDDNSYSTKKKSKKNKK